MSEHDQADQQPQAPGEHAERPGYGLTSKFPVPADAPPPRRGRAARRRTTRKAPK